MGEVVQIRERQPKPVRRIPITVEGRKMCYFTDRGDCAAKTLASCVCPDLRKAMLDDCQGERP
jgi:hypothetical protein